MESRTLHVLEFPKILHALAGHAVSEPGAAACGSIAPESSLELIEILNRELAQATSWVHESGFKLRAFPSLDGVLTFLERPTAILDQDGLYGLRAVLDMAHNARESLKGYAERGWDELMNRVAVDAWPAQSVAGITRCLDPEGRIRDESSPELQDVRNEIRAIHRRCTKHVKDFVLRENLANALQDDFMTISSDRYVLPLKANFKTRTQGIIHDYSQTGETCYFEPMFLVETNNRLQELKREERREERKVLEYITELVRRELDGVTAVYHGLVDLDVLMAKVRLAETFDGRPLEVTGQGATALMDARHPLLALHEGQVVPLDIRLKDHQQALIISGGNAGGKTVCLKTLGLIALMAFSGLPVPVAEGSTLPLWHDIFVVMGDEQSLEGSVSTFTAQIRYLKSSWENVDANTLYLLDEFGAGTDPTQGAALAQAVVDSLMERGAVVVAATHFPALKAYAMAADGVRAASVLFDPGTKKPLFRLAYDQVGASIALDVAREHGLPPEVLERAEKYLLLDGSDTSKVLDRLNAMAVKREQEMDALKTERVKMERKRASLEANFEKERGKVLQDVQAKAQAIVKQWRTDKTGQKKARRELSSIKDQLAGLSPETQEKRTFSWEDIVPGMKVSYSAWNKTGVVVETDPKKRQAKVDMGSVAMWIKGEDLAPAPDNAPGGSRGPAMQPVTPPPSLVLTLDLRGRRADEAMSELERFMDDALLKGAGGVEIIHGRGTGVLRREVHDFLEVYPQVASYALADEDRGGDGMTEVVLK